MSLQNIQKGWGFKFVYLEFVDGVIYTVNIPASNAYEFTWGKTFLNSHYINGFENQNLLRIGKGVRAQNTKIEIEK